VPLSAFQREFMGGSHATQRVPSKVWSVEHTTAQPPSLTGRAKRGAAASSEERTHCLVPVSTVAPT
jgi:hypothetical protein